MTCRVTDTPGLTFPETHIPGDLISILKVITLKKPECLAILSDIGLMDFRVLHLDSPASFSENIFHGLFALSVHRSRHRSTHTTGFDRDGSRADDSHTDKY